MKKVKLIVETQYTRIVNLINDAHWQDLNKKLSFFSANYQFTPSFNKGTWDGRIYLMKGNTFPTGLISKAVEYLKDKKYSVSIVDKRKKPIGSIEYRWVFPHPLRGYQEKATKAFMNAGRGCIVVPTAGGKSAIAMRVIYELKLPFLYLVHTKEARESAVQDMRKCLGIEPTIDELSDHSLITIQSIVNPRARLSQEIAEKNYGLVIIDEFHKAGGEEYFSTLMKLSSYYRFGMTATYGRGDNALLRLLAVTGKVLYREKPKKLIEQKHLARPIITWVDYDKEQMSPYDDYRTAYRVGIVECEDRNNKIVALAKRAIKEKKTTLIIIENVRHGKILEKLFLKAKLRVPFVHGTLPGKKREEYHANFLSGALLCVIATKIYDESINIPNLKVLIMGAGGESSIRAQQRIGRELRIAEGKDTAEYYDFKDTSHRILESHYYTRRRILEKIYGKN